MFLTRLFNICLLSKWWWWLSTSPQLPWASLILHNYYQHNRLWDFTTFQVPVCSHFWKGVIKAVDYFKLGVRFACVDGNTFHFWHDRWFGKQPLAIAFPSLFSIAWSKEATISSQNYNNRCVPEFIIPLSAARVIALASLLRLLHNHLLSLNADQVTWKLDSNGQLSVRSLYLHLYNGQVADFAMQSLWVARAPLKVSNSPCGWLRKGAS